jgi:hypothetical protein
LRWRRRNSKNIEKSIKRIVPITAETDAAITVLLLVDLIAEVCDDGKDDADELED